MAEPAAKPDGVLALQGDFECHREKIQELGQSTVLVREAEQLSEIRSLTLPGGESTTLLKLIDDDFKTALRDFALSGSPVLATCAGTILVAKEVGNPHQDSLGLIDIGVERNSYGRQVDSRVTEIPLSDLGQERLRGKESIEGIFIRAPRITRVGSGVDILASYQGDPVIVSSGNVVVATFHPELNDGFPLIHDFALGIG